MTTYPDITWTEGFARFFGVLARGRSYLNALYLLLAFPLGVFYFCFLAIGLSLGVGLIILWVGLVILALVLLLSWAFSLFEREQANWLLGSEMAPIERPADDAPLLERAKRLLSDRVTWTGPLFLLLKFPLGVASFCVVVTGWALSLSLLFAPFLYPWDVVRFDFGRTVWRIDTLPEALVCSVIGFLLLVITLHVFNGLAWAWKQLAEALLSRPARPADGEVAPTPATA